MVNEKRLIDANALVEKFRDHKDLFLNKMGGFQALLQREKGRVDELDNCIADVINAPTVDAVEVDDKELLKAIKMLVKQYSHSKQSDYVHSPVAHALYHTWKKVDERRTDND